MPKVWVYYEEEPIEGKLVPIRLNIYFGGGVIQWDKSYFYQRIEAPFERRTPADYYDEVMSVSITQGELVLNADKPGYFGVHLPAVKERIEKQRTQESVDLGVFESEPFDINSIEQFVIQLADLEEILQMDIRHYYDWR